MQKRDKGIRGGMGGRVGKEGKGGKEGGRLVDWWCFWTRWVPVL